jgi:hypothetical protein
MNYHWIFNKSNTTGGTSSRSCLSFWSTSVHHQFLVGIVLLKDWLARNQDNVSKWGDMSICRLLFQWPSTIKNNQLFQLNEVYIYSLYHKRNVKFHFSFGHCIVCPSSNYGVWLPPCYLQTFLNVHNGWNIFILDLLCYSC